MEKLERTVNPSIRMGEMCVAAGGDTLRTLLGSCIGLALYDRRRRVGGLAHIVLPDSRDNTANPGKFVDTAIPTMIDQLHAFAGVKLNLIAKLAGGASMFATAVPSRIGLQNVDSCENLLRELRIPIVAQHCGGEKGRRMSFDTSDGKVIIEIVGLDPIEL